MKSKVQKPKKIGNANTVAQLKKEYTPLMYAAEKGYVQAVHSILFKPRPKKDIQVDLQVNQKIEQALLLAVKNGHTKVVSLLTTYDEEEIALDHNVAGIDGNTALMLAASKGDLEIIDLLIQAGATQSMKAVNNRYENALMLAIHQGNQTIVSRLLMTMNSEEVVHLRQYPFYQDVIDVFNHEYAAHRQKIQKIQKEEQLSADLCLTFDNLELDSNLAPFPEQEYSESGKEENSSAANDFSIIESAHKLGLSPDAVEFVPSSKPTSPNSNKENISVENLPIRNTETVQKSTFLLDAVEFVPTFTPSKLNNTASQYVWPSSMKEPAYNKHQRYFPKPQLGRIDF